MSEVILPNIWEATSLETLFTYVIGGDWGKDMSLNVEEYTTVACIRGAEFKNWYSDFGKTAVLRKIKKTSLLSRQLSYGDLLIEISGGGPTQPVGRTVCITNKTLDNFTNTPIVCTNFIRLARPSKLINPIYLNYYLTLFYLSNKIDDYQSGSNNLRNLKFKEYSQIFIPFPSLAEQKVIADLLDQLIAQVDKLKLRLETILTTLKQFRQSVLNAAVTGKLTEDWRKENNLKNWKLSLFEDLILTSGNGISKRQGTKGKNVTVLRLADFQNGKRIYGKERTILLTETELNKYKLQLNDLLVIRVNGSRDIAGLFTIYKENKEEAFCDHFIRFSIKQTLLNPNYFLYVANEGKGRHFFIQSLSTSAGQNTINQKSIKSFSFLLPSLAEQQEIVNRVENYFTFADKIEQQVKSAQERVNNLTPAILAKAFKGELTADWRAKHPELISGENTAEALLKRIQAEQEALTKPTKTKKVKK